jgi:hypothetical protein
MKLYNKLLEVKKSIDFIKKENQGQQYKFVSSSQVLCSLRDKMNDLGIMIIPRVQEASYTPISQSEKGSVTIMTEIKIDYDIVNCENPEEKITISWYGQGVDIQGEKGVGKALTYAEKYLFLKLFNIPTDKDDPDFNQNNNKKSNKKTDNSGNNYVCAECGKALPEAMAKATAKQYGKPYCIGHRPKNEPISRYSETENLIPEDEIPF